MAKMLMERFIKGDVMSNASSTQKLLIVDLCSTGDHKVVEKVLVSP